MTETRSTIPCPHVTRHVVTSPQIGAIDDLARQAVALRPARRTERDTLGANGES